MWSFHGIMITSQINQLYMVHQYLSLKTWSVNPYVRWKVTGPSGFLLDIILASQQHIVPSALQIRAGQWSTIANLWPLNACDWWLFQEIFLSLILLFPRNSSKWSWTCFLGIQTLTKYTQVCFLFIHSFFTCCFVIILCINAPHLFILFHCMSVLLLLVVSQSLCILMLSTFCTFRITTGTKDKNKSFNLASNTFCCEI